MLPSYPLGNVWFPRNDTVTANCGVLVLREKHSRRGSRRFIDGTRTCTKKEAKACRNGSWGHSTTPIKCSELLVLDLYCRSDSVGLKTAICVKSKYYSTSGLCSWPFNIFSWLCGSDWCGNNTCLAGTMLKRPPAPKWRAWRHQTWLHRDFLMRNSHLVGLLPVNRLLRNDGLPTMKM